MIATIYCMAWDYKMDWGLLRTAKAGKYGLRDKLTYKPSFYYFAIVLNFILRFWWLAGVVDWPYEENKERFAYRYQTMAFLSMFAEGLRRTIWALIRVENEFFNNFEQYRSVP